MEGLHPWWPAGIPIHPHVLFETLAYALAWRLFLLDRAAHDPLSDPMQRATLLTVGVVGGALGAKASWWFEDPAATLAHRTDWAFLMQGRSVIGAILGALWAVELAKRGMGVRVATGDAYVRALGFGLALGRVGCFLAGTTDGTHGLPTTLLWGMDLGDGVARHPTALYEIGYLLVLTPLCHRWRAPREGDRFKAWVVGYLGWRLAVEPLKTQPALWMGLSGLQLQCLVGLAYYAVVLGRRWALKQVGARADG